MKISKPLSLDLSSIKKFRNPLEYEKKYLDSFSKMKKDFPQS